MGRLHSIAYVWLLLPSAAVAEWRQVETEHFIIISESSPAQIEEMAVRLESFDKLMRMATGTKAEETVKVRIYEVADLDDVEKAANAPGSGIAGFYDNNSLGPFAVTPRRAPYTDRHFTPGMVLQHEYAHHFMLQYFPAVYPAWYREGFAELIGSSKVLDDGRIGYGMPALHRGNEIAAYWVPLQELLTKEKVVYLDTYAQGWALTHFLTFDSGRSAQLRRYLAALGRGATHAEAAKAFGDLVALNRDARRYVTAGSFSYRPVKVEITLPAIQRSRTLSAGEAALVPETVAFRDDDVTEIGDATERKRESGFRRRNLERIRTKAAQFPTDVFAQQLLADAEFSQGNVAEAEAAIDRLLAVAPDDRGGMSTKSILLSLRSKKVSGDARGDLVRQARSLAIKANRSNPDDPRPLVAYYKSYSLVGEVPSSASVEGLMQAVSLLPRNTSVRQLLVDQLAKEKRYDEAIAWLMPVANNTHKSPKREAARKQMDQLKAARGR